ncbi:MAG: indolepyruvate oxidoreductase subunit beta [Schwartzia sp.]|nr:indolepyruvate oxidoreductase subunit beta [Schwartzia sp. (in: firmicutes)]
MNNNIFFCGVGGQGTVLASKLIASAAMRRGIPVMSAETIGMAQKGGSVFSYLRLGENLHCPMLASGTADIIIGFEPAEAVRSLRYLRPDGCVIVNVHPIMPVTAVLNGGSYKVSEMTEYLKAKVANLTLVDCKRACDEIGSPKAMNMVMLGAAIRTGVMDLSLDDIKAAMRERVKPQFVEMNERALDYAG